MLFSSYSSLSWRLLLRSSTAKQFFPAFLVDLNRWYMAEFGDYLSMEKPHFLVGLIWHELLLLWPLSIVNIYAVLAGKSLFGYHLHVVRSFCPHFYGCYIGRDDRFKEGI
ncbi:unnamed protein product [Arabis nemorensis]|uniref:EXPERA domain-containing protein n=1 Tax=Arabis nemorensis TaxID=586526 RepID=A0A565C196_9BRAS|nr:unnamed protein product [Arabis nemorensis]